MTGRVPRQIRPASVSGRSSAIAPVAWQPGLVTLLRLGDGFVLARRQFRETVGPARRDAMGGRGVDDARRLVAHRVDQLRRLLGRLVRQAEDDDVDLPVELLLGGRILARLGRQARELDAGTPASFSRICSPVVPASPSMKIFAMIASPSPKPKTIALAARAARVSVDAVGRAGRRSWAALSAKAASRSRRLLPRSAAHGGGSTP